MMNSNNTKQYYQLRQLNKTGKPWGIWGSGATGMAAATFLTSRGEPVILYDDKPLSCEKIKELSGVTLASSLDHFLQTAGVIIASPGIDRRILKNFPDVKSSFVEELDIFATFVRTPVIAVTGSLGKTTVVRGLAHILASCGKRIAVGGNIGVPMLSLIDTAHEYDYIILELSSFQLEDIKSFAPNIALWTNFWPNHLDRHGTLEQYWQAKARITLFQKETDIFIRGPQLTQQNQPLNTQAHLIDAPAYHEATHLVTHPDNYALWHLVLHLIVPEKKDCLNELLGDFAPDDHRQQVVKILNGVSWINDSKATIPAATDAALARYAHKKVHLLVGGMSKGVDRQTWIAHLKERAPNIVTLYCFGKEADMLAAAAQAQGCPAFSFHTLEEACVAAHVQAQAPDIVLLSPGGASFDLFKDYQERGNIFCSLVEKLNQEKTIL